jgi:hypothetical protein
MYVRLRNYIVLMLLEYSFIFAEAEALHATFLNPKWHPEVTKYMQNHCCWEEFVERSGYRFELRGAQLMATEVSVGGSLSYSFDIENTGWSSLFSQRRGYVSLFQYLSRGDMQTIIVDGLLEEWVDVTDNFEDEYSPHTTAVADVSSVKLTNDAENLFILISFYNISEGMFYIIINHIVNIVEVTNNVFAVVHRSNAFQQWIFSHIF